MKTITRKNRQTGTRVSVIHGDDLGAEVQPGTIVWYTVCEEHGQICGHATKDVATGFAAEPLTWCEVCIAVLNVLTNSEVAR